MIKLTLTEKNGEPRLLTFDKDEITIGRVSGNDIVLAKGNVSKRHSRFTVKSPGQIEVADLKSTNGTYVNGRKIGSPMLLSASDRVYVGDFLINIDLGVSAAQGDFPADFQGDPQNTAGGGSAGHRLPIPRRLPRRAVGSGRAPRSFRPTTTVRGTRGSVGATTRTSSAWRRARPARGACRFPRPRRRADHRRRWPAADSARATSTMALARPRRRPATSPPRTRGASVSSPIRGTPTTRAAGAPPPPGQGSRRLLRPRLRRSGPPAPRRRRPPTWAATRPGSRRCSAMPPSRRS